MAIRTGRASPSLVERLFGGILRHANAAGTTGNHHGAGCTDALIRPYAANDIPAIEKAIALSDIGLTPNNDGQQIRLSIPALTEDRRRELTKLVSKRAEEARVAMRNIRRDDIQDLRGFEKESIISEDESRRAQEKVQETTDDYIKKVDEIARDKDKEIMTI